MKRSVPVIASIAVLALPPSALAANQAVTTTSMPTDRFSPTSVTVTQGESVTWSNTDGQHNVHFDDNSFLQPPDPLQWDTRWTVSRTFNAIGSFRYYCDVHGGPGGAGMSGTVVVNAPGTPPPPPGGSPPPGGGTGPVYADNVPPRLVFAGAKSQRVLRQRGVTVAVKSNETATLRARGSVTIPGASRVLRFRSVTKRLNAGIEHKVKLGLSRTALRGVRRALQRRVRLTARLSLSARDAGGNIKTAKRKIRLRA
jgi:plastocyanin